MNPPSSTVSESTVDSQAAASAAMSATRPMYWSVRRELWENRSLYIAPLLVAAVVLFGMAISMIGLSHRRRAVLMLNPAQQRAAIEWPYDMATMMLILTAFVVGVFYCLDALHGERRDRSILFWKSLPVSDLTTVLSKASIPMAVLPLVTFGIIVATQMIMRLLSTLALLGDGPSVAATWNRSPVFEMSVVQLYALTAMALWHAPIYGWLLLVSAWARRVTFLWAVLPFFAIAIFEGIAFRTSHFASLLGYRLFGWSTQAFAKPPEVHMPIGPMMPPDPGNFLSTPGLWIGLVFAAAFLAAAAKLRRYREPI